MMWEIMWNFVGFVWIFDLTCGFIDSIISIRDLCWHLFRGDCEGMEQLLILKETDRRNHMDFADFVETISEREE